jgi:hypothetical protein
MPGVDSCRKRPTGDGSKAGWSRSTTRPRRGRPTNLLPLEALERALPQQPFRRDVPIFDVGEKGRLDPRGLRLLDRLRQLGFRAHDGIKLFPDLARDRSRPAGPHLAHVDEILALALSEVQRGHTARILDEADDGGICLAARS